ncbi:MAG: transcriptional regulator [Alphaproteobacteria bacterium]|nr:MAG: transcriptional regulator [Alphaproteobacteria bacterium]
MGRAATAKPLRRDEAAETAYRLEEQVGFLLRRATQRHVAIFSARLGEDLTPMQWAALAKLYELGPTSQNRLGRNTAMDGATIKGVVDRLMGRGLMETRADPEDGRRRVVTLTESGQRLVKRCLSGAVAATDETLAPLTPSERNQLLGLLRKLG